MSFSMLGGMFDSIKQIVMELFEFVPKIIYLLYTSLACVLDVLQLFFRKVAGLDVYYVDGKPVTGDLVTNFIGGILGFNEFKGQYSALTTVFWSFILFGVIMVFISTFVAIIKSHYSYDDKAAKGPMQYVYAGGKALINIAAVPIIVFIGLFVSQALLTALDSLTSVSNSTITELYGSNTSELESVKTQTGSETYIYYDFFGVGSGIKYKSLDVSVIDKAELALVASNNATFSGSMFRVAAFNGNRVRTGEFSTTGAGDFYTGSPVTTFGKPEENLTLFKGAANQDEEVLAEMIDVAFASNLHLNKTVTLYYGGAVEWPKYINGFRTEAFSSFSKFNVGLVWYYYDLWQFNFVVGFAGIIVCASLFINIIMGLITRLFMSLGLFLIAPPLFGLAPIDGGKAAGKWREEFIKQVLMTYGAVVGMNIFFLILPYMNSIDFFNIAIADVFVQALIIIVGLVTIKAFIALVSGLIGAADANNTGSDISKEVGSVAGKAVKMTAGAAKMAVNPVGTVVRGVKGAGAIAVGAAQKVAGVVTNPFGIRTGINKIREKSASKNTKNAEKFEMQNELLTKMSGKSADRDTFLTEAMGLGMDEKSAKKMWKNIGGKNATQNSSGTLDINAARSKMQANDRNYATQSAQYGHGASFARTRFASDKAIIKNREARAHDAVQRAKNTASWGNRAINYGAGQIEKSGLMWLPKTFGNVVSDNEGTKAFNEALYGKKKDDAAKTAENTKAILDKTTHMEDSVNELTRKVEEIEHKI